MCERLKNEVLESIRNTKILSQVNCVGYEDLMEFYFELGESQIKRYLRTDKLTSTLYMLIRKFVIYKLDVAVDSGQDLKQIYENEMFILSNSYDYQLKFDTFFDDYMSILNSYKLLVKIDR